MFSKTFEQIKQENLLLWNKTQGNDFNKAYALLRNYCGYDSYTLSYYTLYYLNTHRDEIYTIVTMYAYEKNGYLKTHPQALVCNIAFLLFYISKKINRDTINPDGRFLAMMHAIEEKTGLQMGVFYQENLVLHAYFKEDVVHRHILECQSWIEFILKNREHFPPNIENDAMQHPINVKSLQCKPYYLRARDIIDTCKNIVINSSEINTLLYCDQEEKYNLPVTNLSDLFAEALTQLPYDTLSYFFEKMLHNKAHQAALNVFLLAEKLIKTKDSYYYSVSNYEELVSKLVDTISHPVKGTLLLKLIAHYNKDYIYSGKVIDWYSTLHAKKQFITHFEQVEKAFIECFDPNMYMVFLKAADAGNVSLIKYLIESNYICLRNNTSISYDYSDKFSRGFYSFVCEEKGGITFTPLQASLLLASFNTNFNLPFLLDVIRLMIAHAPGCVNILDSVERNVGCYVKKIKDSFKSKIGYENQIKQINVIENLLNKAYTTNYNRNIAVYHALKTVQNSDLFLPDELISHISLLLIAQQNEFPKAIESFEISLADYRYKEVLTYSGNLVKSAITYNKFETLLITFCNQIEKPIHSAFLLVLFERIITLYVDQKKAFRWDSNKPEECYIEPNFGMEYLALCRKKQWIHNWPQVERQFQKYFNPNMYPCFESAVQDNQHADIACLLNQLMDNLVNYEEDSQYYKCLLDKWLKSLIENNVYLNVSKDVFDALFFNVEQIKKLPIWEKNELQALTVSFDTLTSQWCSTNPGTFFYVKEEKSSACGRVDRGFDLF